MNCSDMLEMDPENSVTFENGLESELDLESMPLMLPSKESPL